MPAKTSKKSKSKAKKSSSKSSKSMKKVSSMSSMPTPRKSSSDMFFSDPKNMMIIGAVVLVFIVLVMFLGSAGM